MNTKNKEINYQSLFFLGLSLISTGLIFTATINPTFFSIIASGLGLMAIALVNKKNGLTQNTHKNNTKMTTQFWR